MKELLRTIVPVSVWALLSRVKRRLELLTSALRLKLSLPPKKKLRKIQFEVHLAEHCNLNCAGCNHFSPLAEPEFVDPEEFSRDFGRMGELFHHDCTRIFLMGGEPLLHPEIVKLMKTARAAFPDTLIVVYTNGLLLLQKDTDFWRACHDNNIRIMISTYPINLDVPAIKEKAKQFGVSLAWTSAPDAALRDSSFVVSPIDISGSGDITKSFAFCFESNKCITLKHGKLFTCVFAAHAHHFSKYFGIDIPITETDYVDIYKENNGDTVLEKLSRPIPACRYCSGGRFTRSSRKVQWGHSQKDISEWV